MAAFQMNIEDGPGCVSDYGNICTFEEGSFTFRSETSEFSQHTISVGNSLDNNNGGMAGFVGRNHEFFLYCGTKYAEIAIARFNRQIGQWENYKNVQLELDINDEHAFQKIWVSKDPNILYLVPQEWFSDDFEGQVVELDLSKIETRPVTFCIFQQNRDKILARCELEEDPDFESEEYLEFESEEYPEFELEEYPEFESEEYPEFESEEYPEFESEEDSAFESEMERAPKKPRIS
jgi:hypothetical protein